MSESAEDLYLKGFMAFSSKDYDAATAHWRQVLNLDPDHQKAKEGLAKIQAAGTGGSTEPKTKKRTSKEVLADIKRLYAEKKYAEALQLCERLVAKYPDNKDLRGLYSKIESRLEKQRNQAQPSTPTASPAPTPESDDPEGDKIVQADRFVQNGVSLYEVQDYERAIEMWRKALELVPDHRQAQEYIDSVSALVQDETVVDSPSPVAVDPAPEAVAPAPHQVEPEPTPPAPDPQQTKPSKEQMVQIYQDAMALYKEKQYAKALDQWRHILKFYPSHKETLQCIERAEAALAKEEERLALLAQAREALASGQNNEAERILTSLAVEAPHLEGLEDLQKKLEERQRQISELRTLELEDDGDEGESHVSDEEITRYFTPESEAGEEAPREVSRVVKPTKSSGPNKLLLVALPLILILTVGGYLVYDRFFNQEVVATNDSVYVGLVRDIDWNGPQQIAEDFLNLGRDFEDEGEFMLATFSYERALSLAEPRLNALNGMNPSLLNFELTDEQATIRELVTQAKERNRQSVTGIIAQETKNNTLDLAQAEYQRERWESSSERFMALLSNDTENQQLRNMLGEAQYQIALDKLEANELDEALRYFRRAMILLVSYDNCRRHAEVIQRFFHGDIDREEKDQWFFFFMS